MIFSYWTPEAGQEQWVQSWVKGLSALHLYCLHLKGLKIP